MKTCKRCGARKLSTDYYAGRAVCKTCVCAEVKAKTDPAVNQSRSRRHARSSRFGLLDSVGLELRDRACDLCGCPPGTYEKAHHIDHCHETDAVRGVLCTVCNTMLGWVERYKSDPAAIDHYLSKNADYRTVDRES